MPNHDWWDRAANVPGAPAVRLLSSSDPLAWAQSAPTAAAAGGRLLALWVTSGPSPAMPATVRAAYGLGEGTLIVELRLEGPGATYPGLESTFPAASRLQRAGLDLWGIRPDDRDGRPWLRHAAWPAGSFPLATGPMPDPPEVAPADRYPFVRVEGDGVHEIAVGPVHAGIIEPGHFRFSVVGEKVLRLEERLGYVHKGIERRFTELPIAEGHRLAARVSGDSAVAFSWAYCQALEGLGGTQPPRRATWLRALCLEIERIQNHLGDLGALGNDAGFGFGLAQFSRLKEELLRSVCLAIGQRYLLDAVCPGGVSFDLAADTAGALAHCLAQVNSTSRRLQQIYEEHGGLRDRFTGAGQVRPELARRLGMVGLAARASGIGGDLRIDHPCPPYDELRPGTVLRTEGDVAARVAVRFDELFESCRIARSILAGLPGGPVTVPVQTPPAGPLGVGLIEGWRGPLLVALEPGPGGTIRRCYPHRPVAAELAGTRARHHGQHRSGLPPDQQVIQPVLQWP